MRLVDVEQRHIVPQLVIQLRVRVLSARSHRQLPDLQRNEKTHLERDRAPTARAQTPATVHTHHARPVAARRVVAHQPALVVLGDMLADLHLQLRLQARHADRTATLRAVEPRRLDVRVLPGEDSQQGEMEDGGMRKAYLTIAERHTGYSAFACAAAHHKGICVLEPLRVGHERVECPEGHLV